MSNGITLTSTPKNQITVSRLGSTGPAGPIGMPPVDNCRVGLLDYNDLATATTPLNVTGNTGFIDVPNDGAGPFTNKAYTLTDITDLWDAGTGRFDWTELALGDHVNIRMDLEVTTTSPNQVVTAVLELATGAFSYNILFEEVLYKSAGVHPLNRTSFVYMGDENTRGNPARFRISSDDDATVQVNGWALQILKRG